MTFGVLHFHSSWCPSAVSQGVQVYQYLTKTNQEGIVVCFEQQQNSLWGLEVRDTTSELIFRADLGRPLTSVKEDGFRRRSRADE